MVKYSPEDFVEISKGIIIIDDSRQILLRVSKNKVNKKTYLDVREYVTTDRYTGYSRKGVNIPLSKAEDLSDGLRKLLDSLPKGLIVES